MDGGGRRCEIQKQEQVQARMGKEPSVILSEPALINRKAGSVGGEECGAVRCGAVHCGERSLVVHLTISPTRHPNRTPLTPVSPPLALRRLERQATEIVAGRPSAPRGVVEGWENKVRGGKTK